MSERAADLNRPSTRWPGQKAAPQVQPQKPVAPINCLLIDDSKYDRQRVRRIAEQTQMRLDITEAESIDAALTALRARPFDVILVDQRLPDGEGTVVVELLVKHLGKDAPPIVMISGSDEAALPARAFASGCCDYISKDGLNIPGLEKVITGSIARTRTRAPKTTVTMAEHKAALQALADDTVLELRIPLSRMLRLISRAADKYPVAGGELGDLKMICHEMWEYLDVVARSAAQHEA